MIPHLGTAAVGPGDAGTGSKFLRHKAGRAGPEVAASCSQKCPDGPLCDLSSKHPSLAVLGALRRAWHAYAVVQGRVRGSFMDVSVTERRPHTDSSVDNSSGLMYSKPSNSDWSILFMASLCAGRELVMQDPRGAPPTKPTLGSGDTAAGSGPRILAP